MYYPADMACKQVMGRTERPVQGGVFRSRRQFLKLMAASGTALGLAACGQALTPQPLASPAARLAATARPAASVTPPPPPEPIYVTRVVEVTRIVQPAPVATRTQSPEEKNTMIWYVDIELPAYVADPAKKDNFDQVRATRTRVLSDIAQMPAESILYPRVTPELLREKNVRAIALSGNTADWAQYDMSTFDSLKQIVTGGSVPVIGLCGGHQLLAYMYGGECGPIRRLKPGWFKEVGYLPLAIVKDDPIFAGIEPQPVVFQSHYWQVTRTPQEFEVLASTPNCKAQLMRHRQQTIYGTQFHPEVNSIDHRDGRALIANFFRIAGLLTG
jgi:GMP synthase-like glutamine amidotransferase